MNTSENLTNIVESILFGAGRPMRLSEIRNGIKIFSNWPTIPQLYIKGEFIGGCDIVKEMFEKKELQKLLTQKNIQYKKNDNS